MKAKAISMEVTFDYNKHMLNLNSVMIGSMQPKILAEFYEKVFERKADSQDGFWSWKVGETYLSVGEHSEMSGDAKDPGRVMFNFQTEDVRKEFERISKVERVRIIKEPYELQGFWIATLADPDGNYFQLMPPMT